jgi:hypothetical protein
MPERAYEKHTINDADLEPRDFGASEEEITPDTVLDALSKLIVTEENENIIADIRDVIQSASEAYENSAAQEEWNTLWARIEPEVIDPLFNFDDFDEASQNWGYIKAKLLSRIKN